MNAIYKVSVAEGLTYQVFGEFGALKPGAKIVIQCDKFQEYGTVMRQCSQAPIEDPEAYEQQHAQNNKGRHIEGDKIPTFVRIATNEDKVQLQENLTKANDAFKTANDRIAFHNLEMKLIQTHYSLDRKLLVFQFSADGRVDFRELLRDLSATFKVRVELRQVGVRDEASILGGLGTCGRPFCCASFLTGFNSINVKMAKQQGLSLNPQNISGCCGRLKCCLQYESEHYSQLAEEQKQSEKLAREQQASAEFQQENPKAVPEQRNSNEPPSLRKLPDSDKAQKSFTAAPEKKQKHGERDKRQSATEHDKSFQNVDAKILPLQQENSKHNKPQHSQNGQTSGQQRHNPPKQSENHKDTNHRNGTLVNLKNGSDMPLHPHPKENQPKLVNLTNGGEPRNQHNKPKLVSLTDNNDDSGNQHGKPKLLSLTDISKGSNADQAPNAHPPRNSANPPDANAK